MRIPKKYGQSKVNNCPFCGKQSITQNEQGIPVCVEHNTTSLNDCKCMCGDYLDLRQGKFGPYFTCMNCGNLNFNKGLELNPDATNLKISQPEATEPKKKQSQFKFTPTETVVTSDELDFM
ncbi:MAG: hypothetical protein O2779_05590 [Nanoarchaeota archaeon]|nr:hypothetical protein [Nanoarchaeota archaeon]